MDISFVNFDSASHVRKAPTHLFMKRQWNLNIGHGPRELEDFGIVCKKLPECLETKGCMSEQLVISITGALRFYADLQAEAVGLDGYEPGGPGES